MDRVAEETRQRGLRVVAVFEGAKGGLVLVTGFGLLAFLDRGLHNAAEEIVRHLHLNPARDYPRIFLDAAANMAIVAYLGYELTIHGRPPRNPSLPRSPRRSRKT